VSGMTLQARGGKPQDGTSGMTETLVLCYHAISSTWPCSLAVTPKELERQVALLLGRGFVPTTFTQAVLEPPARKSFAVTFDDAFLSVLRLSFPVLSALGVPATVFAPTDFMDSRQTLRWSGIEQWEATPHAAELTGMDWDDLKLLAGSGWEIGSHTRTHPHLARVDDVALDTELVDSRLVCEEAMGRPCTSIAYPYGDADRRVARRAQAAGYQAAAILPSGHRLVPIEPLLYPRTGIYRVDAMWRFRLKLSPIRRVLGPAASPA
jgi:peptidoglycan/xylan/chitin deacetylase (PgdA/CDA1 family)